MITKKHFLNVFLLLVFIPSIGYGFTDACTNPEEYTVDKRCYVTDEEKQQNPYNAVVGFLHQNGSKKACTGTIVKKDGLNKNNKGYFLYTAKHCSDLDFDNIPDNVLKIKLQDGREFDTELVKQGNYNIENGQNIFGDWVQYKIPVDKNDETIPYVKINDSFKKGTQNAQLVGYGRLKIMSDNEINEAIEKYTKVIENFSDTEKNEDGTVKRNEKNGFMKDGGINGPMVMTLFASYFSEYLNWELKKSHCQYSSDGLTYECQSWSGNSGGPIFDEQGNIMGVLVRGNYNIGGEKHAGSSLGLKFKPSGKLTNKQ